MNPDPFLFHRKPSVRHRAGSIWLAASLAFGAIWPALAAAQTPPPQASATSLRALYQTAATRGEGHIADTAVYLRADDAKGRMAGEVLARLDQPYETFRRELVPVQAWCPLLILHLNVKYCRPEGAVPNAALLMGAGNLQGQKFDSLYWARFRHRLLRADDQGFHLELAAAEGPLGTRDYRITVEAEPGATGQTVLRLTYAYRYSTATRLAMLAYLSTVGRHRRGFSVVGHDASGAPILEGGVMGMLERNTMRYYLAVQAWLETAGLPADRRMRRALELNFELNERHPRQLHEVDRNAYLEMKLGEARRQEQQPPPPGAFD